MKKTKQDFDKAFQSLVNQISPLEDKLEKLRELEQTFDNIKKENFLLYDIVALYQKHIEVLFIIHNIPSGAGRKTIPENEAVLMKSLNDFINTKYKYPTEVEWFKWIGKEEYTPVEEATVKSIGTGTINGWGEDKLKKFHNENKSEYYRLKNFYHIKDLLVFEELKKNHNINY
jgi:hypothetical protein